jgi:hypothetical protein
VAGSMSLPIKKITADYTITDNDYTIIVDMKNVTGRNTVTLPSPVGREGRVYNIAMINYWTTDLTHTPTMTRYVLIAGSILPSGQDYNLYISTYVNNKVGNLSAAGGILATINQPYTQTTSNHTVSRSMTFQSDGTNWILISRDFYTAGGEKFEFGVAAYGAGTRFDDIK